MKKSPFLQWRILECYNNSLPGMWANAKWVFASCFPGMVFSGLSRTRISKSTWLGKAWAYRDKRTLWVQNQAELGLRQIPMSANPPEWTGAKETGPGPTSYGFWSGTPNEARVQKLFSCKSAFWAAAQCANRFAPLPRGPYSQLHLLVCSFLLQLTDHQNSVLGQILLLLEAGLLPCWSGSQLHQNHLEIK